MYAVTTDDDELVSLIANVGKQEAAAPANKDDQRALEIAQVRHSARIANKTKPKNKTFADLV